LYAVDKSNNMALIKSVRGFTPVFGTGCYLGENCTIAGDVVIGGRMAANYMTYAGWYT
jgi:hypothetical protein